MTPIRTVALALAALALASTARGQQPSDVPDMPRSAEIVERVNELLDDSPEETLEVPGVARLVYKRLPLDVHAVALRFGQTLSGKQEPRGMDLDRYVRQFEGQIQGVIETRLQQDVGELELLVPVKVKSKAIAPGKYRVGIGLKGGRPAALVLSGEPLPRGKALPLKLKVRRPELEPDAEGALRLALAEPDPQTQGSERFDVVAALRGAEAVTAAPFARVAEVAGDADGSDADEDDEE